MVDVILHCASILKISLPDCLKKKGLKFIEKCMLKNVLNYFSFLMNVKDVNRMSNV